MQKLSRRELPSHSTLRSFEAAAKYESFTLAAAELNLTQGAISRQVKELELAIGTELFRRVGRGVTLTMAGRNLASDLAIDLKNIQSTILRAISAGEMGTALRIACLPTFASRWLIPRLPAFFRENPDIELSLSTRLQPFDLASEHFDMAIHFGQANWPEGQLVPLCSEQLIAVASPELAERHMLETITDLQTAPILHLTERPTAWLDFFAEIGMPMQGALKGKYFDQFNMVIAGATASLGVALLPSYLIETELDTGALIQISDAAMQTDNQYFLVSPLGDSNASVKRLQSWMHSQVGPNQPTLLTRT
jgi:LysR family glycine cleavage system transcriptional activator